MGIDLSAPAPYYYDNCGHYGCGGAYDDHYGGPNVVVGGDWGNGWHGDWRADHRHFHGGR